MSFQLIHATILIQSLIGALVHVEYSMGIGTCGDGTYILPVL
jgi:hypothetical protein